MKLPTRWRFEIPKDLLDPDFYRNGHSDADRVFELCELKLEDQDQASKLANGNASVMTRQMVYAAIVKIGGKTVWHQHDPVDSWYRYMGRRANRLVQDAFTERHSVPEGVTQMFLASAVAVVD
jgi:hypothetical protein